MKLVVDTNVVAYFLLRTEPFVEEVEALWARAPTLSAPSLWEAEIANVLWMAARAGVIDDRAAVRLQRLAARLGVRSVPIRRVRGGALTRALASHVSPYDTLFVELAVREKTQLITFDAKVLGAFPDVAVRPGMLKSA